MKAQEWTQEWAECIKIIKKLDEKRKHLVFSCLYIKYKLWGKMKIENDIRKEKENEF